ncbi:MAG: nucleotidyltransferase family protein, partial [Euryarchaeota archaeon]|nr:nucleotidyltransferase family protein [Euryarchaeota archaeon]
MFGVIMAGGQGSRLYPLTANRPKPMVEVIGRPVIEYVKDAMVDAGVSNIIVTTGYKGDMLEELVDGWCSEESQLESSVNQESTPMGTAGSVRLLLDQLQDTFIVGSGDSVLSCDLKKLVERHKTSNAKVTMALWEVENPSEFGIVGLSEQQSGEVDGSLEEGYVVRFKEKPKAEEAFSNVINAGLYIIEPEALALVPEGE